MEHIFNVILKKEFMILEQREFHANVEEIQTLL